MALITSDCCSTALITSVVSHSCVSYILTVPQHVGPDHLGLGSNGLSSSMLALITSGCGPGRLARRELDGAEPVPAVEAEPEPEVEAETAVKAEPEPVAATAAAATEPEAASSSTAAPEPESASEPADEAELAAAETA